MSSACASCLRRAALLQALAGHLDSVRGQIDEALALSDRDLIAAVGGRRRRELERFLSRFRAEEAARAARDARLEPICKCHDRYPAPLLDLPSAPSVLYVAGEPERFLEAVRARPVALVGSRRASGYGIDTARSLAQGLAATGITVLSGMAFGVDSAAHEGALAAGGSTVAVLPGSADQPYPRARRRLYRQLIRTGAAVSEVPPATPVRRWMLIARNRIIAALSAATVVVEASTDSGALMTAGFARGLGRLVGAVPGRVTTPQATGTNALLADGARIVRGPQDVLDALYGVGVRRAAADCRPELDGDAREVLLAIAAGCDTADALAGTKLAPARALAGLAWLELSGYVRREPGGRFAVIA